MGLGVQVIDAVETGAEKTLVAFQKNGAFARAAAQHESGGRFADRLLHHETGDFDTVAQHPGTGAREYLQRPRMGDLDPGALQHVQRGGVDLPDLVRVDDLQSWFEKQRVGRHCHGISPHSWMKSVNR